MRLILSSLIYVFAFTCGADAACRDMLHAGVRHIVCSYKTDEVHLRLFLKDDGGAHYGRASFLKRSLDQNPLMLMNGGMYHDDLTPVGLYVEGRKRAQTLSTKDGYGNFHLLPNGVFWVNGNRVGVTETAAFAKRRLKPDYATQSGPMLVIDGKLHPRFLKGSDSLKIRNGVGVSKDGGIIHFAISRGVINFWDFGKLFQEKLKAHNALFLDGTVSAIETEGFSQSSWKSIGPIIGVFPKKP